jgi:oligopeptide transport system ATP-binding protein
MSENGSHLLEVDDLVKYFPITRGVIFQKSVGAVHAVDGVSFHLDVGETLGIVGESGCGKTTLGRCVIQLYRPTSGRVLLEGTDLAGLKGSALRHRRRDMQIVFQDPYASLNPRKNVERIVGEPLSIYRVGTRASRKEQVRELLDLVGLSPSHAERYPHEFSGGQRQRIGIARALALDPKLIICDEPVSALDVSIQAQILNLLKDLQKRLRLSYLFIAHDLAVVRHISHRIGVMYLGKLVELAPASYLYSNPLHPYTSGLLSAIPIPDPELEQARKRRLLAGDVPSPANPPSGCVFHPRCFRAQPRCAEESPSLEQRETGQSFACFYPLDREI